MLRSLAPYSQPVRRTLFNQLSSIIDVHLPPGDIILVTGVLSKRRSRGRTSRGCYQRTTGWKRSPGRTRKNTLRKRTQPGARYRRRQTDEFVTETPLAESSGCSSPIQDSLSPVRRKCTFPIIYPKLPDEVEPSSSQGLNSPTRRPRTPEQPSPHFTTPLYSEDDEDTLGSFPPTPTPTLRRRQDSSQESVDNYFTMYEERLEEIDIDSRIFQKLVTGPGQLHSSSTLGRLYYASRKETPGYIKIGWTTKEMNERMKQLSPKGRFGTLTAKAGGLLTHFRHAERLVHAELSNQRRISSFRETPSDQGDRRGEGGGKTEWFQIEQDEASEVCDKWTKWLSQCEPYNQNGELKSFWKSWFSRQVEINPYCKTKHQSLHLRWQALLNPTRCDVYFHKLAEVLSMIEHSYIWVQANRQSLFWVILFFGLWYLFRHMAVVIIVMVTIFCLSQNATTNKTRKRLSKSFV